MNEETEVKQGTFSGWAIVEMMGHRREAGFVTTQAFGQAVLFHPKPFLKNDCISSLAIFPGLIILATPPLRLN